MNLHEYQVKQLIAKYGLPIPMGFSCSTPYEAEESILKIGGTGPWIAKCQVYAGGRAKSGGIKIVQSQKEIYNFAKQWIGNQLITDQTDAMGQPVHKILVEVAICIRKELYLSTVIDRSSRHIIFMASTQGGIEIEKVAKKNPHFIHKVTIDPLTGAQPYQGRELAFKLGLNGKQISQFCKIFMGLEKLLLDCDLLLIEINPLAITSHGDLICLDGKLSIDSNALFRQSELYEMQDWAQENESEVHAAQLGMHYIQLKGNIGCMVNGAGLAMGIMDIVKMYGGEAANFLDIGGGLLKRV